jgi:enamine deaminase RidA (YjgF/YER057c/UK114 family)/acyl-CoA hydrolase
MVLGSHAVVLAGQRASEDVIGAGDFVAEFESALAKLVTAAGGAVENLLQIRVFVTDMDAYVAARPQLADLPAASVIEVGALLGGARVEIEGLASIRPTVAPPGEEDAVIRLRLAPADARYARGLAAGSKAMEIFADLETELALREGGDEGLCVAYDMVEFLAPLRAGDFVEGRARVVARGRSSRRIAAEIHKLLEVDDDGILLPSPEPVLAARASVTIVVGRTPRPEGR